MARPAPAIRRCQAGHRRLPRRQRTAEGRDRWPHRGGLRQNLLPMKTNTDLEIIEVREDFAGRLRSCCAPVPWRFGSVGEGGWLPVLSSKALAVAKAPQQRRT